MILGDLSGLSGLSGCISFHELRVWNARGLQCLALGNQFSLSIRNKNEIDLFFATPVDEEVDIISA